MKTESLAAIRRYQKPDRGEERLTLRFFFAALRLCVKTVVPQSKSHAKTRRRKDAQSQTKTLPLLSAWSRSRTEYSQISWQRSCLIVCAHFGRAGYAIAQIHPASGRSSATPGRPSKRHTPQTQRVADHGN